MRRLGPNEVDEQCAVTGCGNMTAFPYFFHCWPELKGILSKGVAGGMAHCC